MSFSDRNTSKQCMSDIIDKNGEKRQCKNKSKTNFCRHHNKEVQNNIIEEKYVEPYIDPMSNIEYLNSTYKHNLLDLYNSWDEIEISRRIMISNEVWDIDILIKHMTNQLNNSNMENPYPIFPSNPFNRKLFTIEDLQILNNRIKTLNIKVNIALKILLTQPEKKLNIYYEEALNNSTGFSSNLLEILKKNLRFMLLHEKNSQNSYIGMWVLSNFPLTTFEKLYKQLLNIPYQYIIDNNVYDNPYREMLLVEFELYHFDEYNMFDDQFLEYL